MKILLIRPPTTIIEGAARPSVSLPIGLLYIASVLKNNGYNAGIYDAQVNPGLPIYQDDNGEKYMGQTWLGIKEKIALNMPDIVGITNMFTAQVENTLKVAAIVKEVNRDIVVVVGGSHPSVCAEDFFSKTDSVDIACVGEGEYTMLDIAKSLEKKGDTADILGTVVRTKEGLKINPPRPYIKDLDSLPFPAYELINLEDYFFLNTRGFTDRPILNYPGLERAVSIITSRGCPFNCNFCAVHLHMGRQWRYHSVEYIMKHLSFLNSEYNINHIHFEDDNLTLDPERFRGLLRQLLDRHLSLTWDTPNGVRLDTIALDMLPMIKKSGCLYLIFGVESGNQRVLNELIGKQLDLNNVVKVASWCKKMRLDTMAFFIIGFPTETKKEMQDTMNFALDLQKRFDVTPTLFMATPLPGTRLEKTCLELGRFEGRLPSRDLARMTGGGIIFQISEVSVQEMKILIKKFYKRFKIIFLVNTFKFFLIYPQLLIRLVLRLKQAKNTGRSLKELLFNQLQLKNCLKLGLGGTLLKR